MLKYGKNKFSFQPEKNHRLNIDRQSLERIPTGSRVLEIGCATGFMGDYLKKKKNCFVVGVELGSSEAIEAKKVLDHVIVGDIDSKEVLSRIKKLEKFDIIFAAALIEHLHNPWDSLKEWKKFLKKDGKLILSTSNVLHFSQRLKFLQGKFEYTDYGILDNTHLRFFTANTFPRLIKDCGYHVQEVYTDPVGGGYPKLSMLGSLLFPNVFTYQIGIVATS